MSVDNQHDMQDPVTQYKQPDVDGHERQPEPGLDVRLKPQADHGESSYEGSGRLKNRKAIVTGGDSGIGAAVAIAYAREGADVVIVCLPGEIEDAEKTAQLINEAGRKSIILTGDLKDEAFCQEVIEQTVREFGDIDILVNNAGKQVFVDNIEDISTEQFTDTFATNVYATFWLSKFALKHMPKGATIINTTSIQSYQPSPGLLDYASTKGAITSFTKGLAGMLAEKGIRVNGVAPGPIWTPLQPSHGQPAEKLDSFGEQTPIGRAGQPAELAPTYVFLASQESTYITGEIIGVTGGKPIS